MVKLPKPRLKTITLKPILKKEELKQPKPIKKESEAKDIKAKLLLIKKAVEIAVKREAVSLWNWHGYSFYWVVLGLQNWSRLTAKFKQL
jgi:hypothetical protein